MKLSRRQTHALSLPLALTLRALGRSWRLRRQGPGLGALDPQHIDVFWHGQILPFVCVYRDQQCVTMVSEHRDGELIAAVIRRLGAAAVRGSSTRGGARAYLELVKHHRDEPWVITPDGPRGPREQVHAGVIQMAADSGRTIRPHGYACSAARRLDSWDRFLIPHPFARVAEHVGEVLTVPRGIDRSARSALAEELRTRLLHANDAAAALLQTSSRGAEPGDCLQS